MVYSSDDPQLAYDAFHELFFTLYNTHFPVINQRFNKNVHLREPWFSKGLLISRSRKLKLDELAARFPTDFNLNLYKRYRNIYNQVVKSAKKLYYCNAMRGAQSDLKKTWKLIRELANIKEKKSGSNIVCMNLGGGVDSSDPIIIANHFNKYFTTEPAVNSSSITPPPLVEPTEQLLTGTQIYHSSEQPLTDEEIRDAISQLESKTSLDLNGLSMAFLKKCIFLINDPLRHVYNLSLTLGVVPNQLKIAKVVPVFKSGDPTSPENYRPIALLSNISKILEKILCNRLINFL